MLLSILLGVVVLLLLNVACLAVLRIVHHETNSTLSKTQAKLDRALSEIESLNQRLSL
jgi:hypothetical protein